ncbi:MAG: hypothetical protein KDA59_12610, partial [Planctomycetales bacterium]|nr:hypothetical protein [Planctomycetales bacterium]
LLATLAIAASTATGCARINTVPAWKGVPARVIAPSSQEAMAWRHGAPTLHALQASGQGPCQCGNH